MHLINKPFLKLQQNRVNISSSTLSSRSKSIHMAEKKRDKRLAEIIPEAFVNDELQIDCSNPFVQPCLSLCQCQRPSKFFFPPFLYFFLLFIPFSLLIFITDSSSAVTRYIEKCKGLLFRISEFSQKPFKMRLMAFSLWNISEVVHY